MTDPIGYAAAMTELEQILDEIDRDDVDVDQLSVRVRRAAELIKLCRTRIHATRLEVEEIVADLDATSPAESPPESLAQSPVGSLPESLAESPADGRRTSADHDTSA